MVQNPVNQTGAVAHVRAQAERAPVTKTRAASLAVLPERAETTAAAERANALLDRRARTESARSKPAHHLVAVDKLATTANVLRWRAAMTNSNVVAVAVR
jgi:hypothetical protein